MLLMHDRKDAAMRVCLFEDRGVADLEPLTLTRPAFELLCGQTSLAVKQLRFFNATDAGFLIRPQLAEVCRLQYPKKPINDFAWLRSRPDIARQCPLAAAPCAVARLVETLCRHPRRRDCIRAVAAGTARLLFAAHARRLPGNLENDAAAPAGERSICFATCGRSSPSTATRSNST